MTGLSVKILQSIEVVTFFMIIIIYSILIDDIRTKCVTNSYTFLDNKNGVLATLSIILVLNMFMCGNMLYLSSKHIIHRPIFRWAAILHVIQFSLGAAAINEYNNNYDKIISGHNTLLKNILISHISMYLIFLALMVFFMLSSAYLSYEVALIANKGLSDNLSRELEHVREDNKKMTKDSLDKIVESARLDYELRRSKATAELLSQQVRLLEAENSLILKNSNSYLAEVKEYEQLLSRILESESKKQK